MGLDRFLGDSELKGWIPTHERVNTRCQGSAETQRGGFSNVCKKTYDPLPTAFFRHLGGGAECACWRDAVRRYSWNRGTNSNTGNGNAPRKHSNSFRKHGNAAGNSRAAAGKSGDSAGKSGDSDHAATDDPGSRLNFTEDANPGQ
jgi:hypothetical protein